MIGSSLSPMEIDGTGGESSKVCGFVACTGRDCIVRMFLS